MQQVYSFTRYNRFSHYFQDYLPAIEYFDAYCHVRYLMTGKYAAIEYYLLLWHQRKEEIHFYCL